MRIAISSDDNRALEGVVSHHFGRCPYYTFADVKNGEVKHIEVVDNPCYGQHAPGVVPEFIYNQGAQVMITGGMGSRAISLFNQYSIEVVTAASGKVRNALEGYLNGALKGANPCGEGGRQVGGWQAPPAGPQAYEKDEAGRLHEEVVALRRQIAEAMERLAKLEGEWKSTLR